MNGDDFAYGTLSDYYDSIDTNALPFNERPESTENTESMCFLALPLKLNHQLPPKKEKSQKLAFFAKNSSETLTISNEFLDFKAVLLPPMLMSINSIVNKNTIDNSSLGYETPVHLLEAALDDTQSISDNLSRQQILKTAMMLLPTESQWYTLNKLRVHAGAPELTQEGIELMLKYYSQLIGMEKRFPFESNKVQLYFSWRDAFNPEIQIDSSCIEYEKSCVLFNIAAAWSQMGAQQRLWAPEGKKKAAACFQVRAISNN